MNTSMKWSFVSSILPLLILASYSSDTTAQTETPAAPAVVAPSAPAEAPVKNRTGTGTPVGDGRWVKRIDEKTCPKGSTAYIDELNGGVKCWVDDR